MNLSAKQFGQRFSTPFQRAVGYAWNMLRGDVLDLVGGVYGHARGIGEGLYDIGAGIVTFDGQLIGKGLYNLGTALSMPRLNSHGGLNWPGTSDNSGLFPGSGTQVNSASITHDLAVGRPGGFWSSSNHFRWIAEAWTGPGVQPGIYGQAYRLVGTVGFGAAGGGLWAFGF